MTYRRKSKFSKKVAFSALTFFTATLTAGLAFAEGASAPAEDAAAKKPTSVSLAKPNDYCANINNPAADARYALQFKALNELQKKIDDKVSLLEELHQRNLSFEAQQREKMKAVQKAVTDIYSKMKPDVAAGQLELLDPEISVAILNQLNVRAASAILNEMNGTAAATITAAMATAAKVVQP